MFESWNSHQFGRSTSFTQVALWLWAFHQQHHGAAHPVSEYHHNDPNATTLRLGHGERWIPSLSWSSCNGHGGELLCSGARSRKFGSLSSPLWRDEWFLQRNRILHGTLWTLDTLWRDTGDWESKTVIESCFFCEKTGWFSHQLLPFNSQTFVFSWNSAIQHGFIENDKLWGNSTEGWLHLLEVFGRAHLSSSWPAHQPGQRSGVSRGSNLRQFPGVLHGTHSLSQAMPREPCWNVDVFIIFQTQSWYSDFCCVSLVKCNFFHHPFWIFHQCQDVYILERLRWHRIQQLPTLWNLDQTKWDWFNSDQYLCLIDTMVWDQWNTLNDQMFHQWIALPYSFWLFVGVATLLLCQIS